MVDHSFELDKRASGHRSRCALLMLSLECIRRLIGLEALTARSRLRKKYLGSEPSGCGLTAQASQFGFRDDATMATGE